MCLTSGDFCCTEETCGWSKSGMIFLFFGGGGDIRGKLHAVSLTSSPIPPMTSLVHRIMFIKLLSPPMMLLSLDELFIHSPFTQHNHMTWAAVQHLSMSFFLVGIQATKQCELKSVCLVVHALDMQTNGYRCGISTFFGAIQIDVVSVGLCIYCTTQAHKEGGGHKLIYCIVSCFVSSLSSRPRTIH